MSVQNRWRLATLVVTGLLVIYVTQSVLAAAPHSVQNLAHAAAPPHPVQNLARPGAPQTVNTISCGPIKAVKVVSQDSDMTTTSTTFATVPGMSTTVTVPALHTSCFLMRFSAETECVTSSGTFGWCIVRILVDGVEAFPGAGTDFAFDSTYNGTATTDAWQSNSLDRSVAGVTSGSHTVVVQWATTDPSITAWLGEMSLTIERT